MPAEVMSVAFNASDVERIERAMMAAKERSHDAVRRAVNWTGERVETRAARALAKQTGLKVRTAKKALHQHVRRASFSSLSYVMRVTGGNVALKYFGARETNAGVSAAPWGHRGVFPHTFIKGGLFPRRVALRGLNGQVFQRAGTSRLPISKVKSGLFIPTEAVKGETAHAFTSTVAALLPGRVEHEVAAILSGAVR